MSGRRFSTLDPTFKLADYRSVPEAKSTAKFELGVSGCYQQYRREK
jgi:hypothetical protein